LVVLDHPDRRRAGARRRLLGETEDPGGR
jgi:hypothetical protein